MKTRGNVKLVARCNVSCQVGFRAFVQGVLKASYLLCYAKQGYQTFMNTMTKIVNHILDEHFEYIKRDVVDDIEMIKELKFILNGVRNYLKDINEDDEKIQSLLSKFKEFTKERYMKVYIENFDEEDDMTEREKSEEASNYFEYVFDKEEHPY